MPKKNQTARAARKAGKDLLSRKNKKKQGRKGGRRPDPHTPAVIANSIFALTLNSIPGVVVEGNKTLQIGASKMYKDLSLCYQQLVSSLGVAPKLPAEDKPADLKVSDLMILIRRALHQKMDFNIEFIEKNYCIVLYYRCMYANYLPSIQVGNALLKVKKEAPRVHDLFISFLKRFISVTKIDVWYDSNLQHSIGCLEDTLFQNQQEAEEYGPDNVDPEWIEEAKKDLELYEKGSPAEYTKLLLKGKRIDSVDDILKALSRFRKKHPLLTVIKKGCAIIDPSCSMYKYGYNPDKDSDEEYDDNYCLEFANQAMIHWKYEGPVCDEFDSWIDCQANEGVKEPICSVIIHPKAKQKLNEDEFSKMCEWPSKLVEFFSNANEILNKYTKK